MKYDRIFPLFKYLIKTCILLIISAVQTQAGWSFAEDVNLLASGYNRPGSGNAGSGIYLGV